MSALIKSTLILAFSRVTNFALVFFSPILMVRILERAQFGQYREFMAYGLMASSLAAFSITTNVLYFVPKHPEHTKTYVSHTAMLTFAMSVLACLALWIFGDVIRSHTSFDFLWLLAAYVFLFINVDHLESYWIATKQPKYVFYFSTYRTIARLAAVIGTAYVTRSVTAILHAVVAVELLRVLVSLLISLRLGLLRPKIDLAQLRYQFSFITPLGVASSLNYLHRYVGQIVVSAYLGVVALAIYAIASYKVPVIRIIRGAVNDAIFPDMVRQASSNEGDRLRLWKRGNIAYSFLILPITLLLFWYADVLIPLLFTDKYAEAVPLFRILVLLMPIEAIELSSPLRASNRNTQLLVGNLVLLAGNLACIAVFFIFFKDMAIYGPAVGLVFGSFVQHVYMGWRVMRYYGSGLLDLLKWRSQALIYLSTAVSGVVLLAGELVPLPDLLRVVLFSGLYAVVYYFAMRLCKLEEVETVIATVTRKMRRRLS